MIKLSNDSTLKTIYVFRLTIKFSKMQIFISLALIITLLSVKIGANDADDIFATEIIDQYVIEYFQYNQQFHTPAALSNGIPNAERFAIFFQRLSENFLEACKTFENAQFFVSAVQPFTIVKRFNTIIAQFDQTYQAHANRQNMKRNVITTKNQLSEYGNEIASFTLVPFNWINGTNYRAWLHIHRKEFGNVSIAKTLAEYLKHVNDLIVSIRKSIAKSRAKIEHGQLKRLGTKILRSVEKFENSVDEVDDVTSSLGAIRNAIDEVKNSNNGKYFNDMKTNARKILNDLDQLKLLMEKQWTHMDYIFGNRKLPKQLPRVTLAN